MKQLPIPEAAVDDPNAVEMLRVWIAQRGLHCSINIGVYDGSQVSEAIAWGIILADTARHVADAHRSSYNKDADAVLKQIRDHFLSELDDPTSGTKGSFSSKN